MSTSEQSGTRTESPAGDAAAESRYDVELAVNGRRRRVNVRARATLAETLRDELGLTGTHVACEEGWCGACTVLIDGRSARSCLTFAVQADGAEVQTVEGLEDESGELSPVQAAFARHNAVQCGFCTAGFEMLVTEIVDEARTGTAFSDELVRKRLSSNFCRCSTYVQILDATKELLDDVRNA